MNKHIHAHEHIHIHICICIRIHIPLRIGINLYNMGDTLVIKTSLWYHRIRFSPPKEIVELIGSAYYHRN